jgi:hypothetical protein
MNKTEYDRLSIDSNMRNKGRLVFVRQLALKYLTALSLPYFSFTLPLRHFQRVVQFRLGLKTCPTVRCLKCRLHMMDPYGDHAVTCKHGPHTIHRHDHMPYVQKSSLMRRVSSLASRRPA